MKVGPSPILYSAVLMLLSRSLAAQDAAHIIRTIEERQAPNRQGLDPYTIREIMDRFHVPGLSVAVIKDFQLHWARAWGLADVETGAPVNTESTFQAASMSKPVAAMASL